FRKLLPLHRLSGDCRCRRVDRTCTHRALRMTTGPEKRDPLSVLDRPNSYIGKVVPRPNLDRLMQGRGLYVSDIELPRMVHVLFLRSPYAHAKITSIDASAAKRTHGEIAVVPGREHAAAHTTWDS